MGSWLIPPMVEGVGMNSSLCFFRDGGELPVAAPEFPFDLSLGVPFGDTATFVV